MSSLREDGSILSMLGALKLALLEHKLLWKWKLNQKENTNPQSEVPRSDKLESKPFSTLELMLEGEDVFLSPLG